MDCDVLIIGSGLAGIYLALQLPEKYKVIIVTKAKKKASNSIMAQGGIASVGSSEDSFASHIQDTMIAGAGLSDETVVRRVVEGGPKQIKKLIDLLVPFDKNQNNTIHLGLEGGHSHRRIYHVEDHSGESIHSNILKQVLDKKNISIYEDSFAIDLITNKKLNLKPNAKTQCYGAYVYDSNKDEIFSVKAKATVIASGGAGKIYKYTSNWDGATGDGIAMAYRAGCRVSNMEYMQFHPTCLYHPKLKNFLITEAIRGEGAKLLNKDGKDFCTTKHPLGCLAPRDIVARMIDEEMKMSGSECVFLDISHRDPLFIERHFPQILKTCLDIGLDIRKSPIPVVPAAHYLCGGVYSQLDGRTDVDSLYCIGEASCTGLHGANRLASNSLLECMVQAYECNKFISKDLDSFKDLSITIPKWYNSTKTDVDEISVIHHIWDEIRSLMWNYVGIVRSDKRLERAKQRLDYINSEVKEYYWDFKVHTDVLELRNLALVAKLSVKSAQKRKESRGCHFNLDYPKPKSNEAKDTILQFTY